MELLQKDIQHQRMGYSVTEAADVLGLAPSGLWKWIAAGKIHSVKIGNRRVISAHELQRLLTEGLQ
jgi:excisionase family DNA binding protein